jgi:hypothetical protein
MKALKKAIPLAIGTLFLVASAQATTIDFGIPTDLIYNTTDPIVGDVSFWAGDPAQSHDTFVADFVSPGNNYLMSGVADGTGKSPLTGYDAFIGVDRTSSSLFGTVSVDIAADGSVPSGTALTLKAFLAGSLVGTDSFSATDSSYHTLSLALANGADTLYLFDGLNSFNISDTSFHIDNFTYADWVQTCTGPNCGCTGPNCGQPNPTPEPAMLWLLGAGLMGLAVSRKKRSAL